ncbi:MAG: sodium-dependent bicarbonate transport family permease, partial [Pirellula staleyi]
MVLLLSRQRIGDKKYAKLISCILVRSSVRVGMFDVLRVNLCSPLTLAFALGIVARLVRSELALPRDMVASLSTYLLFALGLKGGVELSHSSMH